MYFLQENKAISGKKFYILIFCLCVYSRLSVSNIPYSTVYTHLYTHIINKLLHGCLVCTILFTRCERLLTHSFAALTRSLVIFHNSWIKIVRTRQPWSNLYLPYKKDHHFIFNLVLASMFFSKQSSLNKLIKFQFQNLKFELCMKLLVWWFKCACSWDWTLAWLTVHTGQIDNWTNRQIFLIDFY